MISLRNSEKEDIALIDSWPAYPPDCRELDYALRGNGWLVRSWGKPQARCYIAEDSGMAIGFTILERVEENVAEFRIAMRADKIGHGLGRIIAPMTLDKGFKEMDLACIRLIVRQNNLRALKLYRRLGFAERGECLKDIQGKPVNFLVMEISQNRWCHKRLDAEALFDPFEEQFDLSLTTIKLSDGRRG